MEQATPSPVDDLAARRVRNEALAARWAAQTESQPATPVVAVTPLPSESSVEGGGAVSSVETEKLAAMLKPYVRDGLIGAERWIIDWRGYVPKDIPEDQREELGECVEVILRRMLPDVAVGPWARLGFVLAMSYGAMRVGAEKKPPEVAPVLSPVGAGDTAQTVPGKPESPSPSNPPSESAMADLGSADSVARAV